VEDCAILRDWTGARPTFVLRAVDHRGSAVEFHPEALSPTLEPVFEADLLPCSFRFRPRRAAHDALQVLLDESWRGRR